MTKAKRTIGAGEFKARCLALLDDVAETGRPIIVSKRGKPVAEVIPIRKSAPLAGSVVREGDLVSPIDTDWDASR